jgi:hypothetical protein
MNTEEEKTARPGHFNSCHPENNGCQPGTPAASEEESTVNDGREGAGRVHNGPGGSEYRTIFIL